MGNPISGAYWGSKGGIVVFSVPNMKCGGCAKSVAAALRGADSSAEISVNLERREVAVESAVSAERLAGALRAAGFEAERLAA